MSDSLLITQVIPGKVDYISKETKISDFIDGMKNWNLNKLKGYLRMIMLIK